MNHKQVIVKRLQEAGSGLLMDIIKATNVVDTPEARWVEELALDELINKVDHSIFIPFFESLDRLLLEHVLKLNNLTESEQ